jgi:hypothetical protein
MRQVGSSGRMSWRRLVQVIKLSISNITHQFGQRKILKPQHCATVPLKVENVFILQMGSFEDIFGIYFGPADTDQWGTWAT